MLSTREAENIEDIERVEMGSERQIVTTGPRSGSDVLDPRRLVQPQPIGAVNVKNSKEVTVGTKILNITVDNQEKVKGRFLGLEFVSKTKRTRAIRCSCAVSACCVLIVAIGFLVFILTAILQEPLRRWDTGINETWYIRRNEWQAMDPNDIRFLNTPIDILVIGHTAGRYCNNFADCSNEVRHIQRYHMQERFADIGMNYMVGGGGLIFEGRGPNIRSTFLTNWNDRILSIGFLGNYTFNNDVPDNAQIENLEFLLAQLVQLNALDTNYKLVGKCQITGGGEPSPGGNIMKVIGKFKHWSNQNLTRCTER